MVVYIIMENIQNMPNLDCMQVENNLTYSTELLKEVESWKNNARLLLENPASEKTSIHCLVCNLILIQTEELSYNIFSKLQTAKGVCRASIFEKVGKILDRTLCDINLHSEIVCHRCFNLFVEYEATENKLMRIRSELVSKLVDTATKYDNLQKLFQNDCETDTGELVKVEGDQRKEKECDSIEKVLVNKEEKIINKEGKIRKKQGNGKRLNRSKDKILSNRMNSGDDNNKIKVHVCPVCGKTFRAFSHRVEHMLIHLGEKPWSCEECKKTFRTKSALKVHASKHSGARPYTCQQCGRSYADRGYFEEHCRIHSGERPFVCSFCKRPFARKKDLVVHMKSHTGDKPFACAQCPKIFAVKSRLERHARIHSGERPFPCAYCTKSFARRDDYKVHARQHTGERPFRCSFCNKTFANKSNCLAHVRTHTGTKVYRCNVCSEGFNRRPKLERHLAESHSSQENVQVAEEQPLQTIAVSDLQALQTLPVSQVAQLTWGEGLATATYVNIVPGTYVNIIN